MAKNAGKIDVEMQDGESGISSFAGLWAIDELFRKTGLPEIIDSAAGIQDREDSATASTFSPPSFFSCVEETLRTIFRS